MTVTSPSIRQARARSLQTCWAGNSHILGVMGTPPHFEASRTPLGSHCIAFWARFSVRSSFFGPRIQSHGAAMLKPELQLRILWRPPFVSFLSACSSAIREHQERPTESLEWLPRPIFLYQSKREFLSTNSPLPLVSSPHALPVSMMPVFG
jgi:hypothetical protein